MLAWLRSIVSPEWRTVAAARRAVTFAGTAYPVHGIVDRRPVEVSYRLLLQQDVRGRRRLDVQCFSLGAGRSDLRRDPMARAARAWIRGGAMPAGFLPIPA